MKVPRFPHSSLALRLSVVYGLLSTVVIAAMGLGIYFVTARHLETQAEDQLSALAGFYAAYISATAPDRELLAALAPQIVGYFAPQAGHQVRIFGVPGGALLAATIDTSSPPSSATLAELRHLQPTFFLPASQDQPGRLYAARPIEALDGSPLAVVELSRDIGQQLSFLSTLRWILVGAGALALVSFLVASLVLALQMTRPLQELELATQAIASGDFGRRLPATSQDEIGRLAASVNQMASDLARLEASRREFIARITHDLRTPLTAIKGHAVNLLDTVPEYQRKPLATIDQQTDRLIRLVNELLTLSRLQRGELRMRRAEIDLCAVAKAAVDFVGEKARRHGVELGFRDSGESPVVADPDRLQQVILNLLDNALRATPAGGQVEVRIAERGEELALSVVDTGQGMTPEEIKRAFEPYYRGASGGAGLGLSISREIVDAHGGRIWLNSQPEGGTEAVFTLPRAPVTER